MTVELEETEKNQRWTTGIYSIRFGSMGKNKDDVYHIYKSGKYVAQRNSIAGCKDWIADDIEESKK